MLRPLRRSFFFWRDKLVGSLVALRDTIANTPAAEMPFEREIRMLNIRRAEANDAALILKFIRALAEYEHLSAVRGCDRAGSAARRLRRVNPNFAV